MRDLFPGYFHREPDAAIWKKCIFSFDANFLLNFYRSTPELQKTLFGILGTINDRSWLTHQAALEYYRNRETVIRESLDSYDRVSAMVKEAAKEIEDGLKQYQKHTAIEVEKITEIVKKAAAQVEKLLDELRSKHPNRSKKDEIEEKLTELFEGRVGVPYLPDVLQTVFQKAAQRFSERIPPGYKDEHEKEGYRRFGDVVLWFQLLDLAKERKSPLIFVTADAKEDWWTKGGRPRPELIHEMYLEAKAVFHIYKPAQFVTFASKFLDLKKEAKSVEKAATELREIESQRQSSRETAAALAQLLKPPEPNPMQSRNLADLLKAVRPDPSVSAAFASLADVTKPNPLATYIAEIARPDASAFSASVNLADLIKPSSMLSAQMEEIARSGAAVSARWAELMKPSSILSSQLEEISRSNADVSAYLDRLVKPGPALSAQLGEIAKSNAAVSAYLEGLTKPGPALSAQLEEISKPNAVVSAKLEDPTRLNQASAPSTSTPADAKNAENIREVSKAEPDTKPPKSTGGL
jgi:hypothetical protein